LGSGREIPPTGKSIEVRACQVVKVAGDKIKSVRHYFDIGTLLKQIGADH
jgi:limonene-1,2-epoxide hydrolase